MTSRTSGYVQMEMAERVTSMLFVLHCIIQFYRIVQRDIRYLSSRGSIWLRCTGHDVTGSPTLPYFLPPLFFPEKGNFHGAAREGQRSESTSAAGGWREGGIICPPSANLISSTSAGLLSHRSRYSPARARNGNGIDRPHWIMARESG